MKKIVVMALAALAIAGLSSCSQSQSCAAYAKDDQHSKVHYEDVQ